MIPAPRGQIVDRNGRPLATNRVAYFPALKFPKLSNATDQQIGAYGMAALRQLNQLYFGVGAEAEAKYWRKEARGFIDHYHNRHWLPYLLVGRNELSDRQRATLERDLASFGLVAHPAYMRHYPKGKLASHVIGYTGLKRPLPTGPLENGDPYFFEWEGKSGLEASFDEELSGTPGRINIIFDASGKEIERDMLVQPVAGLTLVTTLDADMQSLAEDVLYFRSSMVVMDSDSGEILAMASCPGYDLNDFVPAISQDVFSGLVDDPDKPLFARAFQAVYPPASTFKLPIAIAALKSGTIAPNSTFDCPNRIKIGRIYMRNWHAKGEGKMKLQRAIARSCNTWFYTVGQMVGADLLVREARNFGFGQLTKIPLDENPGLLPTDAWMIETWGHRMYAGDVANFSIGQGYVEATPLQVAQSMTGIANGTDIWRARLIKQKQDHHNGVVSLSKKESIGRVEMSDKLLAAIRSGMVDVVHAGHGTGKSGYCSYAQIAAKTGTAQWKGNKKMTWFAGYLPANDPQFTFAIAFEGGSSGGGTVAPIAKKYFNALYGGRDPEKDLYTMVRVPGKDKKKEAKGEDENGEEVASAQPERKKRTQKRPPPQEVTKKPGTKTVPAKPKKRSFPRSHSRAALSRRFLRGPSPLKVSLISAMTPDRVIGTGKGIPWHMPRDIRHFRSSTAGKPMLLGRRTFEEMAGWFTSQTPIVMTRQERYEAPVGSPRGSRCAERRRPGR